MTRQPDPMAAIGRAVRIIAESGDPEAALVAEALDRWRRSRSASFEEAAGWASNLRATAMQRNRDAALQRLGRQLQGRSGHTVARAVHRTVRGYETTRWTADHAAHHRPDGPDGDCYDVLFNGELPGIEHLRKVVLRKTAVRH